MTNVVVVTSLTLDGSCRRRASPTSTRCWGLDGVSSPTAAHLVRLQTRRQRDGHSVTATGVLVASYQPTRTDGGYEYQG